MPLLPERSNMIKFIKDFFQNINEKWRLQNLQERNNRKLLADYDFAHEVARELSDILIEEDIPLCAPITGPNSFNTLKVFVDTEKGFSRILFGLRPKNIGRCGSPEVYMKIKDSLNSTIYNNVRYEITPAIGDTFPLVFPLLAKGVKVCAAREQQGDVQIVVSVNAIPDYRMYI